MNLKVKNKSSQLSEKSKAASSSSVLARLAEGRFRGYYTVSGNEFRAAYYHGLASVTSIVGSGDNEQATKLMIHPVPGRSSSSEILTRIIYSLSMTWFE